MITEKGQYREYRERCQQWPLLPDIKSSQCVMFPTGTNYKLKAYNLNFHSKIWPQFYLLTPLPKFRICSKFLCMA